VRNRSGSRRQVPGIPPVTAWIGAALALLMIILAVSGLAGCKVGLQDPCRHHGGTTGMVGGGIHECADGTER